MATDICVAGVMGELLPPDTNFVRANREDLIGLTVEGFRLNDDRTSLYINGTRDGKRELYQLEVWGDCCSWSWIEDVFEADALIGRAILRVEDLDLTTPANGKDCVNCSGDHETTIELDGTITDRDDHDCLEYYGFAIYTEVGRFVIDFRNDSNGYYGGSLVITRAL